MGVFDSGKMGDYFGGFNSSVQVGLYLLPNVSLWMKSAVRRDAQPREEFATTPGLSLPPPFLFVGSCL